MIMGIDPGFGRIGYAFITATEEPRVLDLGMISSSSKHSFPHRLGEIQKDFVELIARHHPSMAAVEKLFFVKNLKTGIDVAQARGVLLAALVAHQVEIFEYSPTEIKKNITGRGRASKLEVAMMVQKILGLKERVAQDDASDALAIALSHWYRHI